MLARREATPSEELVAAYRLHLDRVRGLAAKTRRLHSATAAALLAFLDFDHEPMRLRALGSPEVEAFVRATAARLGRDSLQHTVAHLRSFLRFLASRDEVARGLDASIDTPRLYRGERLPRAIPWESVQVFLGAIDHSTPSGRRDHAMFLLIATYGLRASEVAALRLDDIDWRGGRLRVPRPKIRTPLELPLTDEVGAALFDYVRHVRPDLPCREVFVRLRAPLGPIGSTTVSEAFRSCTGRAALPIPNQGPHCLRHSLAVHLLRQGTSLKAIGDLLGHRSAESTCVYLRLHVDDLRDAALALPKGARPWRARMAGRSIDPGLPEIAGRSPCPSSRIASAMRGADPGTLVSTRVSPSWSRHRYAWPTRKRRKRRPRAWSTRPRAADQMLVVSFAGRLAGRFASAVMASAMRCMSSRLFELHAKSVMPSLCLTITRYHSPDCSSATLFTRSKRMTMLPTPAEHTPCTTSSFSFTSAVTTQPSAVLARMRLFTSSRGLAMRCGCAVYGMDMMEEETTQPESAITVSSRYLDMPNR